MATKRILYGVQHFYEDIIPKAYYYSSWNYLTVQKAYFWGTFCEEVHSKCTEDDRNMLDEYFHSKSNKLKNCYHSSLCFQNLQYARKILTQAFIENSSIEKSFIINILQEQQIDTEFYAKNMTEVNTLETLCCELVESLKLVYIKDSDRSFYYEIKSELFLDYLKNSLKHMQTEKQEEHLQFAFETMCESEDKMMTLINVFLQSLTKTNSELLEIQMFGLNWMTLKLYNEKKCKLFHFLFSLPLEKLRSLATKYKAFYEYYIETLSKSVELLEMQNKNKKDLSSWFSAANSILLSLDQVFRCLKCLLNIDDDIAKFTQEFIILKSESDSMMWKEIVSKLINE